MNYGVDLNDVSMATIGGTAVGAGNLISGNTVIGVFIDGSTATANLVAGNYIGTDIAGKMAVANLQGVLIADGASNNTIGGLTTTPGTGAGNVISGNTDSGVVMTVANTNVGPIGNRVEGNLIGTDEQGMNALGNGADGVFIDAGASGNTIGGTVAGAGNVISGNAHDGIEIDGTGTADNTVAGNFVGTNAAGTAPVANGTGPQLTPNGDAGIEIEPGASANTIGGTTSAARNLISGNGSYGIAIDFYTSANVVEGNYIGTDFTGNAALGTHVGYMGVLVQGQYNTIGGTASGAGNVIAGNDRTGSFFAGDQLVFGNAYEYDTTGNVVQGNLIGLARTARQSPVP